MKKIFPLIFSVLLGTFFVFSNAFAYVSVKGYTTKSGKYVAPYVRSNPNGLKSDNYGYTPSQGTYNPTYGTRGSTWDTPTTTTDPNYYQGKAIYDLNHSNSTSTPAVTSPSLYQLPSAVATTKTFNSRYYNGHKVFIELLDKDLVVGRMLKGVTDPATYIGDSNGCLRWITSEGVAKRLYGDNWNQNINWMEDALINSYKICDPINE